MEYLHFHPCCPETQRERERERERQTETEEERETVSEVVTCKYK